MERANNALLQLPGRQRVLNFSNTLDLALMTSFKDLVSQLDREDVDPRYEFYPFCVSGENGIRVVARQIAVLVPDLREELLVTPLKELDQVEIIPIDHVPDNLTYKDVGYGEYLAFRNEILMQQGQSN